MQAGCSHNWEEPNLFITCPLIRISTGNFIHSQGFYGDTWLWWFCKNLCCWKNQTSWLHRLDSNFHWQFSQGFYGGTWLCWFCKNLHWLSADPATIGKYRTSLLHACRKGWTEVFCHFANPASWKPLMYTEDLCGLLQILAEGGHYVQWRKEDDRNILSIFLWSSVYKPLLVVQK